MVADFFSKPLQGSKFKMMRDWVLGHTHIKTSFDEPMTTNEERVGDQDLSHVGIGVKKRSYADVTRVGKASKQVNT
jgi:hypothetical protein